MATTTRTATGAAPPGVALPNRGGSVAAALAAVVAADPHPPEWLADVPHSELRLAYARHRAATAEALGRLADDDYVLVRTAALAGVADADGRLVSRRWWPEHLSALAANPHLSPERREALARARTPLVRRGVARNPAVAPERAVEIVLGLPLAWQGGALGAATALAVLDVHGAAAAEGLARGHHGVRLGVAASPHAPVEVLAALAEDHRPRVALLAGSHPTLVAASGPGPHAEARRRAAAEAETLVHPAAAAASPWWLRDDREPDATIVDAFAHNGVVAGDHARAVEAAGGDEGEGGWWVVPDGHPAAAAAATAGPPPHDRGTHCGVPLRDRGMFAALSSMESLDDRAHPRHVDALVAALSHMPRESLWDACRGDADADVPRFRRPAFTPSAEALLSLAALDGEARADALALLPTWHGSVDDLVATVNAARARGHAR